MPKKKKSSKAKSQMTKKKLAISLLAVFVIVVGLVVINSDSSSTTKSSDGVAANVPANQIPQDNDNSPQPCLGNTHDECKVAPSVDFYPTGSEGASNPDYTASGDQKEIMGRIQSISTKSIVIKSSSGRIFTVNFPINAASNFDSVRDDYTVEVGDMLYVAYNESPGSSSLTIEPSQLQRSVLLLNEVKVKTDAPTKY